MRIRRWKIGYLKKKYRHGWGGKYYAPNYTGRDVWFFYIEHDRRRA